MVRKVMTVFLLVVIFSCLMFHSAYAILEENFGTQFIDHFDGISVDEDKWVVEENNLNFSGYPAYGGSVKIANSSIILSSNGSTFPYVYTCENPFPMEGNFILQFDVTYTCIGDWGNGIMISQGTPGIIRTNSSSFFYLPADTWENRIFTLWAHDQGTDKGMVYINLFDTMIWKTYVSGFRPAGEKMTFKLEYSESVYTVFVDEKIVGSMASDIRPDVIVMGHPPVYYLPLSPESVAQWSYWGWSSFKIGSIGLLEKSQISFSTKVQTQQVGYKVQINGQLKDSFDEPIVGENVIISYAIPGIDVWNPIVAASTDDEGFFSAVWLPSATGEFSLKAEWVGNEYLIGTNDVKNVSIFHEENLNFFTAESNSTLSSLSFNSTEKSLYFTVSGESGTTGYVRFLFSREIMPTATDFKVYLDGQEVNFTIIEYEDILVLYFEYHHSSHKIIINMPVSSIPEFPTEILFLICLAITVPLIIRKRHLILKN